MTKQNSKKIILLKGLPGSGKSTYVEKLMQENPGKYKRVGKDFLRNMLDDGRWSKHNEKFVLNLRDHVILKALEGGNHVIVDDTNLHPRHEARIRQITKGLAEVQIEDFTDVDVEVCIERDLQRCHSVGEKVIKKQCLLLVAGMVVVKKIQLKGSMKITSTIPSYL